MELLHGKLDIRFLRIPTTFSAMWSQIPCGPFSSIEDPILFWTWTNKWPLSNIKLPCKYGDDFNICHTFFFSFLSQEMSLNIYMKILPVKVSGVSPNLLSRSVTLPQKRNVVNPGKIFHSNHFFRHRLCSFCRWRSVLSFLSKLCWTEDVDEPFQDTTQNPRKRRLLRVEDW